MVRTRPALPAGHGEVLTRPTFAEWEGLLAANRERMRAWDFSVAGRPVAQVRAEARAEVLACAEGFSARLGVDVAAPRAADAPIVMTGHQPELYHPGVWVKDFLLQRIGELAGATAVDVVVDSDGFDVLAVSAPCMTPGVARCRQYLALGGDTAAFATASVPDAHALDDFCRAADEMLASLPAPAVRRHFATFSEHLRDAARDAGNLAELVTFARRRYEASAGTDYLEVLVTSVAHTPSYLRFVADIALSAERFAGAYNAELAEYRALTKTRSAAQPFPDLGVGEGAFELPLWRLGPQGRAALWAHPVNGGVDLVADGATIVRLPPEPQAAVEALLACDATIAPKALALTLFTRMFACDLFIHGVGGGRYDQVTDGVVRRFYGVEPPRFVVASMTMYLPLGAHVVTDEEVAAAKERLNRLEHNPDALLDEVEFDSADERARAVALATEKAQLVAAIGAPDADRKALGGRIREVNAELAEILAPLRAGFEAELASLTTQRAASEILTDRTYPFCFWDPQEVADKVR